MAGTRRACPRPNRASGRLQAWCIEPSPALRCPTWTVDGTPSDCVNIALAHLLPPELKPDAVLSGINIGLNASLGFIIASGTIAGAWEGALHGLPLDPDGRPYAYDPRTGAVSSAAGRILGDR